MSNYSFCKKNGDIKERFKFACQNIVLSKPKHTIVKTGRQHAIAEEYDCYVIPRIEISSKKKYRYLSNIVEVCNAFEVKTRAWYSHNDISIDLVGENTSYMIEILNGLLEDCADVR